MIQAPVYACFILHEGVGQSRMVLINLVSCVYYSPCNLQTEGGLLEVYLAPSTAACLACLGAWGLVNMDKPSIILSACNVAYCPNHVYAWDTFFKMQRKEIRGRLLKPPDPRSQND